MGTPLFERSNKRVRLTSAGERFLPYAVAVLDTLKKGLSEVQQEAEQLTGVLRIAAIPTIGPYILPGILKELRTKAPKLTLELYEETTSVLLEHLREGRIDVGILALPVSAPGVIGRAIGKEPLLLCCSKQHPWASRKSLSLKELKSEKLLILQEGHCFSVQTLEYCKRSREDAQVIFQGSSLTSVMRLAAAGQGVTLVPSIAVDPRANPDLRFIPFADTKPQREIGLVWRISSPLTRAGRVMMTAVEQHLQELLKSASSAVSG